MKDKLRELITHNRIELENAKMEQQVYTLNRESVQMKRSEYVRQREYWDETSVKALGFIGSSIVRDIDSKKIEKRNPYQPHTECIPGGKIQDVINGVLKLIKVYSSIENIVVHIGGNHIPYDGPEVIIDKLSNMYRNLQEITPQSKFYHSNILPRFHNYVSGIRFINTEMEKFCRKYRINVINHPQFYDGEKTNYKLFKNDYIHPTPNDTSIIARNIIAVYRKYHIL